MTREQVENSYTVQKDDVNKARLRVAEHSQGKEDLQELLLMLGLITDDPDAQDPPVMTVERGLGTRIEALGKR